MTKTKRSVFYIALFLCFLPMVTPAIALFAGVLLSFSGFKEQTISKHTTLVLQASIVLMGFGMQWTELIETSKSGFMSTAISVASVMALGLLMGKLLKLDSKLSLLISVGTAICGGCAIAAVAPVIKPKHHQLSFALAVVFVLNGVALFVFPYVGRLLHLSQETFGYWAAIAIHDTSSVVGAGASYGDEALRVATTVKLVRALWIIPLTLLIAIFNRNNDKQRVKIPWFIGLFILCIAVAYLWPQFTVFYGIMQWGGHKGMVIALFLIGSNISLQAAKAAGLKSFLMGTCLWLAIAMGALFFLMH